MKALFILLCGVMSSLTYHFLMTSLQRIKTQMLRCCACCFERCCYEKPKISGGVAMLLLARA